MADVDDDAALLGRARRRQELAVLHGVVAGAAVGVREDVARAQQVEQVRELARRRPDVAHDADVLAGHLGGANGPPQRLEAVLADDGVGDPHLHAEHDAGILGDHLGAAVHVGVLDVEHLARGQPAGQADRGDVHEGVEPRARGGQR